MRAVILAAVLSSLAISGSAQDKSGVFDYYVVSLSWSPNWCERTGNARGSQQCDPQKAFGWILHGLWPQYERGWPQLNNQEMIEVIFYTERVILVKPNNINALKLEQRLLN